jgi:FdhE protein
MAEGLSPLDAASHRRDPIWRDGLSILLASGDREATPAPARAAIRRLREFDALQVETLANDFLSANVASADLGEAFYVAAALQVYFARLASALPDAGLHLLPERGLCPCCGSTPVVGIVTEAGNVAGSRYLHCSLCGTAWNHVRAVCITCQQSRSLVLRSIGGERDPVQAETCDECRTYAKVLYRTRSAELDPFADDLATVDLDVAASDAGWSRHAPNPLLLIGSKE